MARGTCALRSVSTEVESLGFVMLKLTDFVASVLPALSAER